MDEIRFDSLNELYTRLYPAFNTCKNEFIKNGIHVREIDLWNYLKENVWSLNNNLNLYDMVNDIFDIDIKKLQNYLNKTK